MVRTETSVFTVDGSTTHPDCSTMSTDRCLNTSRRTDPSPATDQGRHWLPGRLACYMLAVLAALSVLPVAAQDQDTTAPELRSVSINRVGLRLTYDEELDDDSEPDISAFTVTVNGASREVRTVVVIRTFVLVFLYSPVQAGETVTVSYTVPATNPVQDLSGNRAAAITNLPVSNNTPATAPPAPTNLTAQAGDRSVTLTWTTSGNGGSAITKHQYQEKIESGLFGNWMNIPNSAEGQANANSYTVPNRTNGTTYTYKVRAVNAQGESTESNEDSARPTATVTSTAPPAPTNLTAQAGDRSVTLTWTTPGNGGSTITKHQYREKIESGEFGNWMNIPNSAEGQANANSYTVPNRTNGITYTFEVRAVNAQGESTESNQASARPILSSYPPLSVSPIAYKTVEQGKLITPIHLSASGGWEPYTYSISGAPSSISLSSGNRITGSPSQSGTFTITVTVTDVRGSTGEHSFRMSVYSKELTKKFSPILILTEHPTRTDRIVLFPEPVEIMGAESISNLWFHFADAAGHRLNSLDLSYEDLNSEMALPGVPQPLTALITDYQNQYPDINFSQNKFASIPDELYLTSPIIIGIVSTSRVYAHFDYPGNDKVSWNNTYTGSGPKRGDHPNFPHTAYVHAFERSDGNVVIRYYYFYPFNDFQNNHEGDWPYINVIVNSFDPNMARLIGVDYKFHGKGLTYSITGERIFNPRTHFVAPAEGGTHPVVYVGAGSHGGYPTGGTYPDPGGRLVDLGPLEIGWDEGMTTDGIVLSTNVKDTNPDAAESYDLIFLPNPDPNQPNKGLSPEMSWLGTGAKWGTLEVESLGSGIPRLEETNDAPKGPAHKDSWGMSDSGSSYPHSDVPYTEFQQFPIVQDVIWSGTINLIGDIVVYPGATLRIEAGTTIKSSRKRDIHGLKNASRGRHTSPGVDIINYGTITADASEGNSIVFRSDILAPGGWYGIRNYGMLTMRNCVIQDGLVAIEGNGTQTLEDVAFMNNLLAIGIESIADVDAIRGEAITDIQVAASGGRGVQGHSYSLSDAPKGISISNSGIISGTPSKSGTFTVGVTVQDIVTVRDTLYGQGQAGFTPDPIIVYPPQRISAISDFTMRVVGPLTVAEIDDITVEQNNPINTIRVSASGGWPSYTYAIAGGLEGDADLSINSSGEITGTPTETGDFTLTVTVSDTKDNTVSTTFNLSVYTVTQPLSIESIADVIATQNVAITPIQVTASGGGGAYTYSIESDPSTGSGLSIDSNGRITGRPTASGNFRITVTVEDAPGRDLPTQVSRSFSMTVNAPTHVTPPLTIAEINDITVKISGVQTNSPITPIQVSASGGQMPYAYSMSSNPATGAGLSINSSSGQITGTPTQRGTFTLTVSVTDNASTTTTESFSMAVRLIADFNDDGVVNISDHLLFLEVFGLTEDDDGFNAEMDLNGDGTIGIPDFLIFVSHFGSAA